MRFLHISDLHLGKTMNDIRLVDDDQPYWIEKFLEIVDKEKPDAVVIAGDVYDRSSPSSEAVALLDKFLTSLSDRGVSVVMTSGNHDNAGRVSYGRDIFSRNGIYISSPLTGKNKTVSSVKLKDEHGEVTFWMVPYVFPSLINELFETDQNTYDSAYRFLLEQSGIDYSGRNVIVAHQNVVKEGVKEDFGGSETQVAGLGGIIYTAFEKFEYAALGHIHKPQKVGCDHIRYAGSPLCYHFDEAKFSAGKGTVLVELGEKGTPAEIRIIPIEPRHRVREIEGTYEEIVQSILHSDKKGEYLKAVLTDRKRDAEITQKLRAIAESQGSILAELVSRSQENSFTDEYRASGKNRTVSEFFGDFFRYKNDGNDPSDNDLTVISLFDEFGCDSSIDEMAEKIISMIQNQEGK